MRRSPSSALARVRRGTAAVEFALVLPFLCFIFLVTIDFCRVFYYSITVNNCARNGALYGSADVNHALNANGIQTAAKADAGNLNLSLIGVNSSTDNSAMPTRVNVTVTYPFSTITHYPGIPSQTNLSRTVSMSVVPQTPSFQ